MPAFDSQERMSRPWDLLLTRMSNRAIVEVTCQAPIGLTRDGGAPYPVAARIRRMFLASHSRSGSVRHAFGQAESGRAGWDHGVAQQEG
jgi:hypothetical protein